MSNPLIASVEELDRIRVRAKGLFAHPKEMAYVMKEELQKVNAEMRDLQKPGRYGNMIKVADLDMPYQHSLVYGDRAPENLRGKLVTANVSGISLTRRNRLSATALMEVMEDMKAWLPSGGDVNPRYWDIPPMATLRPIQIKWDTSVMDIEAAVRNKVVASGGSGATMNRVLQYYPKFGSKVQSITAAEAEAMMQRQGYPSAEALYEAELFPLEFGGPRAVYAHAHADAGLPTLGKVGDPGILDACIEEADTLLISASQMLLPKYRNSRRNLGFTDKEIDAMVERFTFELRQKRPDLLTTLGKCKTDAYTVEKVLGRQMRLYCVAPRATLLAAQRVTQVFAGTIRTLPENSNALNFSFANGGANVFCDFMDREVCKRKVAHSNCGDDTAIMITLPDGRTLRFDADISSMDLSCHVGVLSQPRYAIFRRLAAIDTTSALVWLTLAAKRSIVIAASTHVLMPHGNPSGQSLVSNVNGGIVDVGLERARDEILPKLEALSVMSDADTKKTVVKLYEDVFQRMGFKVRIEHMQIFDGLDVTAPFTESCALIPFRYLGYDLVGVRTYTDEAIESATVECMAAATGPVVVHPIADIARGLSSMAYGSPVYIKDMEQYMYMVGLTANGLITSIGAPCGITKSWAKHLYTIVDATKDLMIAQERLGNNAGRLRVVMLEDEADPDTKEQRLPEKLFDPKGCIERFERGLPWAFSGMLGDMEDCTLPSGAVVSVRVQVALLAKAALRRIPRARALSLLRAKELGPVRRIGMPPPTKGKKVPAEDKEMMMAMMARDSVTNQMVQRSGKSMRKALRAGVVSDQEFGDERPADDLYDMIEDMADMAEERFMEDEESGRMRRRFVD